MCTAFEVGIPISFASKAEFDIYPADIVSTNTFFIEIGLDDTDNNFQLHNGRLSKYWLSLMISPLHMVQEENMCWSSLLDINFNITRSS